MRAKSTINTNKATERILVSYKYPVKDLSASEGTGTWLEDLYDDIFGQLSAPYRILRELKDEQVYDDEGKDDEDHEANVILRNLVLSELYAQVLEPHQNASFRSTLR